MTQDEMNALIEKSRKGLTTLEEETIVLEQMDSNPEFREAVVNTTNLDRLIRLYVAYEQMPYSEQAQEAILKRWQNERNNPNK